MSGFHFVVSSSYFRKRYLFRIIYFVYDILCCCYLNHSFVFVFGDGEPLMIHTYCNTRRLVNTMQNVFLDPYCDIYFVKRKGDLDVIQASIFWIYLSIYIIHIHITINNLTITYILVCKCIKVCNLFLRSWSSCEAYLLTEAKFSKLRVVYLNMLLSFFHKSFQYSIRVI